MTGYVVQSLLSEQIEAHGGVTVRWTPPEGGLPTLSAALSQALGKAAAGPQTRTFRGEDAISDAMEWIVEIIRDDPALWTDFADWYELEGDAAEEYDYPYDTEFVDYYWVEGRGQMGDFDILPPE